MAESIENIVEKISNKNLSELIKILKLSVDIVDIDRRNSFIMGYCASTSKIYSQFIDYLQKHMEIPRESTFSFGLPQNSSDILFQLYKVKDKINNIPDDLVLIGVTGFEKMLGVSNKGRRHRAGHDYDQNIKESSLLTFNKKIMIVTHIDTAAQNYEESIRSALSSQFKDFLYEF